MTVGATAQTFIEAEIELGPSGFGSFVPDSGPPATGKWADYDNDGDLDLIVTGYGQEFFPGIIGPTRTTIYRNDGNDTFTANNTVLPEGPFGAIEWGDFDGDGDVDLLFSGYDDEPFTTIFQNRGTDLFQTVDAGLIDLASGDVDWGDFDNDGDLDILQIGLDENPFTRVYRNEGSGQFAELDPDFVQVRSGDAEFADIDNDGDLDVLVSGLDFNEQAVTKIYRNEGNGQWTDVNANLLDVYSTSAAFGDVDGDGDLDLFLTGVADEFSDAESMLYTNDGSGQFTAVGANLIAVFNGNAAWADYDADGDVDLLVAGLFGVFDTVPKLELYENDGSGNLTAVSDLGLPLGIQNFQWGDYDNDGDLDLVTIGDPFEDQDGDGEDDFSTVPEVNIFRSTIDPTANSPAVPTDLAAESDGDILTLSWQHPGGASNAVSYNIRVGTEPGAMDIVSSMTDPALGTRLVSDRGNVDLNTSWTLHELPDGDYYWTVQAIASDGTASAFASEQTVSVGPIDAAGDVNNDGVVNVTDLLLLLGAWGPASNLPAADLTSDGVINVNDLLMLLANWS